MDKNDSINHQNFGVLLQKQLDKLGDIQKKALSLEQKDPAQDMLEVIYLELGRAFQELSEHNALQEELETFKVEKYNLAIKNLAQQEEIERMMKEQEAQQEEIERYLALLKFRDFENDNLRNEIAQLNQWLHSLQKNFKAILESPCWKTGSALVGLPYILFFRKKSHVNADRMLTIFSKFETWTQKEKLPTQKEFARTTVDEDVKLLTRWLEQLQVKIEGLLQSRRWKVGNFLATFFLAALGKGKIPRQVKKIQGVFSDYKSWCQNSGNENRDINKLSRWIETIEHNYMSLINSRRWKIGNRIVSTINTLSLKKQTKLATRSIEKIFSDYHKWQQE